VAPYALSSAEPNRGSTGHQASKYPLRLRFATAHRVDPNAGILRDDLHVSWDATPAVTCIPERS
jgi:hypothetical protein